MAVQLMSIINTKVAIVGAGPAGSSAAYMLARQGIDVLVLEKYEMPRYKTCGGGVNVRAARHIPFSIEPVIERVIHEYQFTFRGAKSFVRSYPEPLTYMTQRLLLDKYLMDKACEVGARLLTGATVRQISMTDEDVTITTSAGDEVRAQVVIGADGANSTVARALGMMHGVRHELAMESEISLSAVDMDAWGDKIEVELFSLKYGYGWVFPKAHHISIGVGGLRSDVEEMKAYNRAYLARHEHASQAVMKYSGHALPVRDGSAPMFMERAVLVGDAAGLLEPFTGEGIGYAVRSGQIASDTISDYLEGRCTTLQDYQMRVNKEIVTELQYAQQYVRIFNRFPRLFYRLIRESDYAWESACKILRGERTFGDINRKLGRLAPALNIIAATKAV